MTNNLIIENRIITAPIYDILQSVRRELHNGKLSDIIDKRENVLISCPSHKGGMEKHASCTVYADPNGNRTQYGAAHCFTCGYTASLPKLIGDCFDKDEYFGKSWLLDRFGDTLYGMDIVLPELDLETPTVSTPTYLDSSVLSQYDSYLPYMWTRKLSQEVVDKFQIGYDKKKDAITFPVYDEHHGLVMITEREVKTKRFYIPSDVEKPVYLLYDILERGVDKVFVCESQINTLTMRTWGYDSVGLFGTGSAHQYQVLKESGLRKFVLCFDGDEAGRKGASRFIKNMSDIFPLVQVVQVPNGKDINDLTKEEFDALYEDAKHRLI